MLFLLKFVCVFAHTEKIDAEKIYQFNSVVTNASMVHISLVVRYSVENFELCNYHESPRDISTLMLCKVGRTTWLPHVCKE